MSQATTENSNPPQSENKIQQQKEQSQQPVNVVVQPGDKVTPTI